ncbi:MAG TPA: hypothetical protein VME01_10660, partial [Solirubrobacteraceae bacterium]|nr:hypothetical protein [Solirubrobacteraceae bacterium]
MLALALPASSVAGVGHSSSIPRASGRLSTVILMLRDKPAGLRARSEARTLSLRAEQNPLVALLRSHGARDIKVGHSLPFVIARVSAAQRRALAKNSLVAAIMTNTKIPNPTIPAAPTLAPTPKQGVKSHISPATISDPSICGTATNPENDPEADGVINSTAANALGYDGAGVTVAYIAGGIDTTIPDFQRNPAYASAGSPSGAPVVTAVNFSGDPAGTPDTSGAGGESFLDASSIVAQGNTVY